MSFRPSNTGTGINTILGNASDQAGKLVDKFNTSGILPTSSSPVAKFPIEDTPSVVDQFVNWGQIGMDGLGDFNKVFGYEFVITKISQGTKDRTMFVDKRLFLPLPPTSIAMNVPVAVNLSVTQKGILEESNGAPLRSLTITGTSGVINADVVSAKATLSSSIVDYAFRNTIQAANRVNSTFNQLSAAISGNPVPNGSYPLNVSVSQDQNPNLLTKTGFYDFTNMARFFDYYLALKKGPNGRYYRLHFNMYKDRMYYDVTLNNFSWQKAPGTIEYAYNIALTAWKQRRKPAGDVQRPDSAQLVTAAQDPLNVLARVVNSLAAARRFLSSVSGLVRGLRSDADDVVFGPLRETILLGKDIVGVVKTLADMPQSIIGSGKASILSAIRDLKGSNAELSSALDAAVKAKGLFGSPAISSQSALSDQVENRAAFTLSDSANQPEGSSPSELLFEDPTSFAAIFEQLAVDDIPFSQAMVDAIQDEQDRVDSTTVQDLVKKRDRLKSFSNSYAERVGAGNATYNRVNGLNPPVNNINILSLSDIEIMGHLNDILIGIDQFIVALKKLLAVPQNDYFKFYVNYAINNGLTLQDASSKFLVPFPVGATLESLAVQYLDDIDRWPEIAAINGLKAPYVDEDGYTIPLKASGSTNTVLVTDPMKLYVGAVVKVYSDTQRARQFQVTKIETFSVNETLVTFQDGDDMSPYKIQDNAQILAYLPDTVNSTKLIGIPSQAAANPNFRINIGPGVKDLNGLAQLSQTDFLLNSQGDLVVTSGGNIQRAYGYTNIVQAARIKLLTQQGSMLHRPLFGNPVQPGSSSADISLTEIIKDMNEMFLADPRFSGILAGRAVMKGPAVYFDLLLGLSGININLPITTLVPVS